MRCLSANLRSDHEHSEELRQEVKTVAIEELTLELDWLIAQELRLTQKEWAALRKTC